jgi:hypothetical protein
MKTLNRSRLKRIRKLAEELDLEDDDVDQGNMDPHIDHLLNAVSAAIQSGDKDKAKKIMQMLLDSMDEEDQDETEDSDDSTDAGQAESRRFRRRRGNRSLVEYALPQRGESEVNWLFDGVTIVPGIPAKSDEQIAWLMN